MAFLLRYLCGPACAGFSVAEQLFGKTKNYADYLKKETFSF